MESPGRGPRRRSTADLADKDQTADAGIPSSHPLNGYRRRPGPVPTWHAGTQIIPICVACAGSGHIREAAPIGGSGASASMAGNRVP